MTTHPQDPATVGSFAIQRRLGRGAMGAVYLARSPGGRLVAVKVVRAELADDAGFRARFAREVDAARKVGGAFTAAVVDADPDAERPWLATEYLPGPTLQKAIESDGPLSADGVRLLAAGLAEALTAIHAGGLVHRDLKPSNILLTSNGPRVIDFGIARALEEVGLTATGLVVGTPGYLSPEQITGGAIGPASDVFALGAVLVFAASGQGPYATGSPASLLHRIVNDPPRIPPLPAPLYDVVRRCLDRDPTQRPTPTEIIHLLNPTTQPAPPTVQLPPPTKLLPPPPTPHPLPPTLQTQSPPPPASAPHAPTLQAEMQPPSGSAPHSPQPQSSAPPPAPASHLQSSPHASPPPPPSPNLQASHSAAVPYQPELQAQSPHSSAPAAYPRNPQGGAQQSGSGSSASASHGLGADPISTFPPAPGSFSGQAGGPGVRDGVMFVTSRVRPGLLAAGCTALWLAFIPQDPTVQALHPALSTLSALISLTFLVFAVRFWILVLRRKVALRLSPQGLTITRAGREVTVPWYGVTRLRVEGDVKRPWLIAWLEPSYQDQLPTAGRHHGGLRIYPIAHGATGKRRRARINELRAALNWYAGRLHDNSY